MKVVDASVIIKVLLTEQDSEKAKQLLQDPSVQILRVRVFLQWLAILVDSKKLEPALNCARHRERA